MSLKQYRGKMEFIVIPIGHVGTTLKQIQLSLANALSATRPNIERIRTRGVPDSGTDSTTRTHDQRVSLQVHVDRTHGASTNRSPSHHYTYATFSSLAYMVIKPNPCIFGRNLSAFTCHSLAKGSRTRACDAHLTHRGEHRNHMTSHDSSIITHLRFNMHI